MQMRFVASGTVAFLLAVLYFLAQPWEAVRVSLTDLLFVIVSGACAFLGWLTVRQWGLKGKFGFVHSGLFLAVLLWFLGETTWSLYEIVLNVPIPYPSIADVFYLAGYFPAALGMVQFMSFFGRGMKRPRVLAAAGLGLIVVAVTFFLLIDRLAIAPTDILTKVFDVAYPSLDALLLALAVFMIFTVEGGSIARPWFWIALGMLLNAVADIAFSLGTLDGWYFSGHPVELIWLWAYISIGVGFYGQGGVIKWETDTKKAPR